MNTLTGHTQAVSHKGQVTGRGNSGESQNRDENRQPLTPYKAMIRWDRIIPGLPIYFDKKYGQTDRSQSMETFETLPGKLEKEQEGFLTILLPKKDIPLSLFFNLSSYYKQKSFWQDSNHCTIG